MPAMRKGARHAARTRSAVVTLGVLLTLCVTSFSLHRYGLSALDVELTAVRGWLAGDGLYSYRVPGSQTGAALSPALALLLAPLTPLPLAVAGWLLALMSVAALLLTMVVLAGPLARRHGRGRAAVVLTLTGLALLTGPVRATIGLGRPDLLLIGLIVADLVALRRMTWVQGRGGWMRGRGTWLEGRAKWLRSRVTWFPRRTTLLQSRIDSLQDRESGPRRTSWLRRRRAWASDRTEALRDRDSWRPDRTVTEPLRDRVWEPRGTEDEPLRVRASWLLRRGAWASGSAHAESLRDRGSWLRRRGAGEPGGSDAHGLRNPASWMSGRTEAPRDRSSWMSDRTGALRGPDSWPPDRTEARGDRGSGRPDRTDTAPLRGRASWLRRRAPRWFGRSGIEALRDRSVLTRLHRGWASGTWAGVGTGLATALSAAPLLFIGYLLLTGQRRAGLTALATASTVTLGAALAAPGETLTWFGTTLWELDRTAPIGTPDNLSLAGVLARLYGFSAPPVLVWLSFGVLLLAVGLIRARSAHIEGDELAAFTLIALTVAVAGPVTTTAEAIWLLPAVMILADAALHRKLGAGVARPARLAGMGCAVAALTGYAVLVAGPPWTIGWNTSALAMILLLNALPWRQGSPPAIKARRPIREPAIPGPRGG